jgi:heme ABC exporter ATP-binding subunit CcmA
MYPMDLSVRIRSAVALAGRYPLLSGVDLDARPGEVVVLRGPNGAGKTSLLRAIAGLLPLVAGEATVLGLDPTADARELRARVGMLGHNNGLYHDLSAEENVRFALRAARLPPKGAALALERLGVGGRLKSLPTGKLSAGQRRRVALAALFARRPELWLLDEPHAGLDPDHRALLDGLLREVASGGATVFVASHDMYVVSNLADRVVPMSGGMALGGTLGTQGPAPLAPPSLAPRAKGAPGTEPAPPAEEAIGVA